MEYWTASVHYLWKSLLHGQTPRPRSGAARHPSDRRHPHLHELSDRLGVDERTVRRYVDHLLDLDVPVESVRGRYGGYRLAPGYRMPPLMLTDDEAVAVLLGLIGTRRATLQPDTAVAVESATAKVHRVLPRALAGRLDALVAATSYADEGRTPTTPETGVLLTVAQAAVRRRPLAITYRDKKDRPTERVLEPYGVVAHRGRWYATGLDSRSGQVRSFRLTGSRTLSSRKASSRCPAGSTRRRR
jgi:predicted DNA-binding transcriptional regulator YafY